MGLLKEFTWDQRRSQNRALYTDQDRVMFGEVKSNGSLPYAAGIWNAWESLRYHLFLAPTGNLIPAHWRLTDVIDALHPFAALNGERTLGLNKTLGKLGAKTQIIHLWEVSTNSWRNFDAKMQRLRSIPQWLRDLTQSFPDCISQAFGITWSHQVDPDIWVWSNNSPTNGGFLLPNAQIYELLQ